MIIFCLTVPNLRARVSHVFYLMSKGGKARVQGVFYNSRDICKHSKQPQRLYKTHLQVGGAPYSVAFMCYTLFTGAIHTLVSNEHSVVCS